jgi:lysophospholipase L1-like esterase
VAAPYDLLACSGASSLGTETSPQQDLPAQIADLRKLSPQAGFITITIGGNDGPGFGNVLYNCAFHWDSLCELGVKQESAYLADKEPKLLDQDFKAIKAAAPHATLLVAPYPHLWSTGGCGHFGESEVIRLNALTNVLDETIEKAAKAVSGVQFVPGTETAFNDHWECSSDPWVLGTDAPKADEFHPNPAGQQAIASIVADYIGAHL